MKYQKININKCRIIFFDLEFYVPERSRTKTGFCYNPWDKSCKILGGSFLIANPEKDFGLAELDANKKLTPGPGANDGASGVAVLLELARVLPGILEENLQQNQIYDDSSVQQVWLVFFDLEDNGDIPGYDWILGSTEFVKSLEEHPSAAVIIDMIGDSNLKIYIEANSNEYLSEEIWEHANKLGYGEQFIPQSKYSILDDHIPFLENGIDAVDIIDFDYAYWHTTQDTIDKVSPESLKIVGDTLLKWIQNKRFD